VILSPHPETRRLNWKRSRRTKMPRRRHDHDVHQYVRVVFPNKTIWKWD
jgi:hypothetical protein